MKSCGTTNNAIRALEPPSIDFPCKGARFSGRIKQMFESNGYKARNGWRADRKPIVDHPDPTTAAHRVTRGNTALNMPPDLATFQHSKSGSSKPGRRTMAVRPRANTHPSPPTESCSSSTAATPPVPARSPEAAVQSGGGELSLRQQRGTVSLVPYLPTQPDVLNLERVRPAGRCAGACAALGAWLASEQLITVDVPAALLTGA